MTTMKTLMLHLLTLVVTFQVALSEKGDFCSYVNAGTFWGKHTSCTWWGKETLAIVVGEKIHLFDIPANIAKFGGNDISALDATHTDTDWFRDWNSEGWVRHRGDLKGLYKISPTKRVNTLKVVMESVNMSVVEEVADTSSDSRFYNPSLIAGKRVRGLFWPRFIGNQTQLKTFDFYEFNKETRWPPGIIHDMDETDVWAWMTYYLIDPRQVLMHTFQFAERTFFRGHKINIGMFAFRHSYFISFHNGHMYLYKDLSRIPGIPSPFDKEPRGFVYRKTGTMFLFADAKGCVYTIFGWNRPDLFDWSTRRDKEDVRFKAIGTPVEKFFKCSSEHKPSEKLDPNRCSIEPLKGNEGRLGDGFDWDAYYLGKEGGSSALYTYLLAGGALLVVAILGVTAYKCLKGGGGFKGLSGSLGKGKSKQKPGSSSSSTGKSSGKSSDAAGSLTASSAGATKVGKIGGSKAAK